MLCAGTPSSQLFTRKQGCLYFPSSPRYARKADEDHASLKLFNWQQAGKSNSVGKQRTRASNKEHASGSQKQYVPGRKPRLVGGSHDPSRRCRIRTVAPAPPRFINGRGTGSVLEIDREKLDPFLLIFAQFSTNSAVTGGNPAELKNSNRRFCQIPLGFWTLGTGTVKCKARHSFCLLI
jgi:hypothetical protein